MSSPIFASTPSSFRSDYFFDNDGTDIVNDQTDVGDGQPAAGNNNNTTTTQSGQHSSPNSSSASPAGSPAQHPAVPPRRATLDGLAGLELVHHWHHHIIIAPCNMDDCNGIE
jgi:hypothetical protein